MLKKTNLQTSDFYLINACLSAIFYAIGSGVASISHWLRSMIYRYRLDGNLSKVKSWWEAGRVLLLFTALISMFSLSAQTPRRDSGADGLTQLMQQNKLPHLKIGDSLPTEFWNQSLALHYADGKSGTITLESLKGKLLVIDFWATYCSPCVKSLEKWNAWQDEFADVVTVIPIHLYDFSAKALPFAKKRNWRLPMVYGNTVDTAINQLFYYDRSYGQIWIRDGKVFAIPVSWEVTQLDVYHALLGIPPKMNLLLTHEEKLKERGMQR